MLQILKNACIELDVCFFLFTSKNSTRKKCEYTIFSVNFHEIFYKFGKCMHRVKCGPAICSELLGHLEEKVCNTCPMPQHHTEAPEYRNSMVLRGSSKCCRGFQVRVTEEFLLNSPPNMPRIVGILVVITGKLNFHLCTVSSPVVFNFVW